MKAAKITKPDFKKIVASMVADKEQISTKVREGKKEELKGKYKFA